MSASVVEAQEPPDETTAPAETPPVPPAADPPAADPATTAAPAPAEAPVEEWSAEEATTSYQIHGFVSQGFLWSTANNYLAQSSRGSVEFFEAGLNVTAELGSKLRAGIQIFAQDLGTLGNYDPFIDWAYVDYRVNPKFGFKAGRMRLPTGFYNDNLDVDVARTPVLLPSSVYAADFREILSAITGAMVYGTLDLGGAGGLDYTAYGGVVPSPSRGELVLDMHYAAGARLTWQGPIQGLRVAAYVFNSAFDLVMELPTGSSATEVDHWIFGGGVDYAAEDLTLTLEMSAWKMDTTSDMPMMADQSGQTALRGYAMAQYRLTDTWSVSAYGSVYYGDLAAESGSSNTTKDLAATLRYDVTPNWVIKAEGHFIDGTAQLSPDLNPDSTQIEETWGLFLAKTSVAF